MEPEARIFRQCGLFAVCIVLASAAALCPSSRADSACPEPGDYSLLRFDENYDYLKDPRCRNDVWDPIKYIALNRSGAYVSFGGEIREQYELLNHDLWGAAPADNHGYSLQRYELHSDLHLNEQVRFFLELYSALEYGRPGGPRLAIDQQQLGLENAFVEFNAPIDDHSDSVRVRLGYQEMEFGSGRLIDVREGPNVRQNWDGIRLTLFLHGWQVDAFGTSVPRNTLLGTGSGIFDNGPASGQWFWGLGGKGLLFAEGRLGVALYYLGFARPDAQFEAGTAHELRHTLGTRIFGRRGPFDFEVECDLQLGRFGTENILAWMIAGNVGHTFAFPLSPRLGLQGHSASGDRSPGGSILRTFNPLFSKGGDFGDLNILSAANLTDIRPSLSIVPAEHWTAEVDWDFFWRQSAADGIYLLNDQLLRQANGSDASYVGSQPRAAIHWQVDRHLSFESAYEYFWSGPFLHQSPPGRDINYCYVRMTYKF